MLDELRKLLGLTSAAPAQPPVVPQVVSAVPVMSDIPSQEMVPSAEPSMVPVAVPQGIPEYGPMLSETGEDAYNQYTSGLADGVRPMDLSEWRRSKYNEKVPEIHNKIEQQREDLKDYQTEKGVSAAHAFGHVGSGEEKRAYEEANAANIAAGGRSITQEEFVGDLEKAEEDARKKKEVVEKDPNAQKIMKLASGMTPDQFRALKSGPMSQVQQASTGFLAGLFDGIPFKEMMEGAANSLGELWDDPAIQKALIYYTGARLMGYSGSGSGMAAGQVLLKGWDNQAKLEAAGAETAAEAKANDSIDMSKTVNYVDKYGNFQKVYASKNGKYLNHPQLGTIDVTKTGWRPAATGEKDRQTRKLDATDSVNRIQDQVLNKLNSQTKNADGEGMYDKGNVAKVTQMFQEAGLSQQMVDSYTDSYGIDGLEKSIPMLRRAIESYASAVALGEEVNIASLMGHLDRSMITSGKTQVPKSIYHSEGKVVSSDAMNTLSKELNKVHGVQNDMIARVEASAMTEDQKTEFIYTMKTEATKADILIQLNKRFNAIPPKHMDFWKKQAKDSNKYSPFIMWMSSTTDPGRQNSSYNSLNINVYRDLGLMPSNKKE